MSYVQKNMKIYLALVFITFSCFVVVTEIRKLFASSPILNKIDIYKAQQKFRHCLKKITTVYYNESIRFVEEFDTCMKVYFPIDRQRFSYFQSKEENEIKNAFLPLASDFKNEECGLLSFGNGGINDIEETIAKKYHNCKIYNVQPVIFEQKNANKKHHSSKKEPKNKIENKFALSKLLDDTVHSRLIHYLFIDIERHEMTTLNEYIKYGKFKRDNITICQIHLKLNDPAIGRQYPKDINRVQRLLDFVAEPTFYVPIFTSVSYTQPQNITFINVQNLECEKAFKVESYFVN